MPAEWKPTQAQLAAAHGQTIPDVVGNGLDVLFVGINPSLYSAAVGRHFARPGNRFWPALHAGGFTERVLSPFEDRRLIDYGLGITNMVDRATARAAELHDEEYVAGAAALAKKIARYRPRFAAFVGVTAYRTAFGRKQAVLGPQGESIAGARIWVLPNPSGLNAHYQLADFGELFAELRHAVSAAASHSHSIHRGDSQ